MPSGSKPGERRGGRTKGVPNKATADLKALAQPYTKEAIEGLAELARNAESEQVRANAWNALLDRAYGRPSQAVTGEGGEGPVVVEIVKFSGEDTPSK